MEEVVRNTPIKEQMPLAAALVMYLEDRLLQVKVVQAVFILPGET